MEYTNRRLLALATCTLLALCLVACGEGRAPGADSSATGDANQANASSTASTDPAKLDAEIERLEMEAGRRPGDDAVRSALAVAYVRRANARRAAGQAHEAMRDYQSALRANPDNEEAQQGVAEISPQVEEGEETGENGEPAPLPISPGVTTGDDTSSPSPSATPSPSRTATPGRRP